MLLKRVWKMSYYSSYRRNYDYCPSKGAPLRLEACKKLTRVQRYLGPVHSRSAVHSVNEKQKLPCTMWCMANRNTKNGVHLLEILSPRLAQYIALKHAALDFASRCTVAPSIEVSKRAPGIATSNAQRFYTPCSKVILCYFNNEYPMGLLAGTTLAAQHNFREKRLTHFLWNATNQFPTRLYKRFFVKVF